MKLFAALAIGFCLSGVALGASDSPPIAPPFGLSWVETRSRVATMIEEAHLRLSQKESAAGQEIWTVEGFDTPGLSAVLFYFAGDNLEEMELQYRDPNWSLQKFGEFLQQVKEQLDLKYGRGTVLAHSREPQKDVSQTVVGYRWQQPDQALDLVFYGAERKPLAFRLLSMHYRVLHPVAAAAPPGAGGKLGALKKP